MNVVGRMLNIFHIPLREMVIIFVSFVHPIIAFTMLGKKEKLLPHFAQRNEKNKLKAFPLFYAFIFHFYLPPHNLHHHHPREFTARVLHLFINCFPSLELAIVKKESARMVLTHSFSCFPFPISLFNVAVNVET